MVETGSTNADLLDAARQGAPQGLVRVTDHQTAGRGRQSRTWHDEPGTALLVSVLLRPPAPVAGLVPLATGLAVVDAVGALARSDVTIGLESVTGLVALKWPNDVLAPAHGERKVAGILAEAISGPDLAVVVGTGVNLGPAAGRPAEIASRAVSLAEVLGRPIDRWVALDAYLVALDRRLGDLEARGPSAVLDPYRERSCTLGRDVHLDVPGGEVRGRAVDVDGSGRLLVDDGRTTVAVTAGEAHHLGPAR